MQAKKYFVFIQQIFIECPICIPGTVSGPEDTVVSKTVQYPCVHVAYILAVRTNLPAVDRLVRNRESNFSLHLEEANGPSQARAV